jgi:hypothetical protein
LLSVATAGPSGRLIVLTNGAGGQGFGHVTEHGLKALHFSIAREKPELI